MKALVVLLVSSAMFLFGVTAFAYNAMTGTAFNNAQTIRSWIGKPADQVISSLGQPSYSSRRGGRLIYDYVVETGHVGPIETYQFVVGPNGKVDAAKAVF